MEATRSTPALARSFQLCCTVLAALAIWMVGMPAARAASVPVTVTVNSVRNISVGDALSLPPDFYARIWIDGNVSQTLIVFNSNGFVDPVGWTVTRSVSRAKLGGVAPVRIELWDFDRNEWVFDTMVDIDSASCVPMDSFGCAELSVSSGPIRSDSYAQDLVLNLFDGSWVGVSPIGDSNLGPPMDENPRIACTRGAGPNSAEICFTITLGTPGAETLIVSKVTDSNRDFCAPADCSLREAVKLAESGDTVRLPASPRPYELTLSAIALEPLWPPPGSHLRVLQNPLIIEGPTNGGVAVIQQTQADSRVFDVHSGAKLRMSRVSITGGGAGDNSTAFPSHIHGGGIHNHGKIDLKHVTITGNQAISSDLPSTGGGGGIYNAGSGTARLTNVTIAGNTSLTTSGDVGLGGGIAGPGTYVLRNTVIANNIATKLSTGTQTWSNCGQGTTLNIVDDGGNWQFPGSDCGRKSGFPENVWLTSIPQAPSDPLMRIVPRRFTYLPVAFGPAVDSGVAGCGPTDQTGATAPVDGNGDGSAVCDSGAIELQR